MVLLLRLLAALFFALAVLGAFLPLVPTTPFLLLTSWCLVRSSPRLHAALHRSRLFGPLLADWERHHGVRAHVKVAAVGAIALAVAWGLLGADLGRVGSVALCALAAVGLVVVLRLPTVDARP